MKSSQAGGKRRMPRLVEVSAVIIVMSAAVFLLAGLWLGEWMLTVEGQPRRLDFLAFWTAARLALAGKAAAAYDPTLFRSAYEALGGRDFRLPLGWHNPPHFLILLTPFALLPYPVAFLSWIATTALIFVLAIRRILPQLPGAPIVALALPAGFVTAWLGQNAFLIGALFGFGFSFLRALPGTAGLLLGLISVKPHFGIVLPILLAVGGQWRCFASASATVLGAAAVSAALFGGGSWIAFSGSIGPSGAAYLGDFRPDTLQSVYALTSRVLGPGIAAGAVHGAVALLATAVAAAVWYRETKPELLAASAIGASFLVPPYAFQYDIVTLGVGIAFLVRLGLDDGWQRGERVLLALIGAFPVVTIFWGTGLPGPIGYATLLLLAARRSLVSRASAQL